MSAAARRSRVPDVRRLRGWNAAVAASAAIVLVAALALAIGWLVSLHSSTTTYSVTALLTQVDLDLSAGQAVIVSSSSPALQVQRTDHYAFGHAALERRWLAHGVLHITSRCPRIVLGSCSAAYELAVPEAVGINVQTRDGDVRMTGFNGNAVVRTRSGNIDIEAYCGFHLSATSRAGDINVAAACAPQSLSVRSGSGNAVALVPPGRYRVAATSGAGAVRVAGVVSDPTAPFTIDAISSSGGVTVEGGL